jgi:hypothetical protein
MPLSIKLVPTYHSLITACRNKIKEDKKHKKRGQIPLCRKKRGGALRK